MKQSVVVTKDVYVQLLVDQEKLCRLEAGGVDNWERYGESLCIDGEPDMYEFREKMKIQVQEL